MAARAKLDDYETIRATHHFKPEAGGAPLGRYSLDLGIMHTRTTLDWIEKTIAAIGADLDDTRPADEPPAHI